MQRLEAGKTMLTMGVGESLSLPDGSYSCYTHGAMLCYLYNRCGYETMRLVGESAYEGAGDHSWCLTKTDDGWHHYDAQFFTIREADEQFGVNDETYWQWFH